MAADGIVTVPSKFGARETMDRLESQIKARGMTVFARIDHAAGAAQVNLSLRPTEVIIFGNAKAGTPLIEADQLIGLDLPLRMLVWEDASGKTWLSYNEPSGLTKRHGLGGNSETVASAMAASLSALTKAATD